MNLNVWRVDATFDPRVVPGCGLEIGQFLIRQTSRQSPRVIRQDIPQQNRTRFTEKQSELPVSARFLVAGPKQGMFDCFETEPPRGDSPFRPNSQRVVCDRTTDDVFGLREVVPVLAVFIGVAGRWQFLHFITENPEKILADSLRVHPVPCKPNCAVVRGGL